MSEDVYERLARLETGMVDIRATLARLESFLVKVMDTQVRILESQAEMRGQIEQMSLRISGISARLPVPIAYTPPSKPAA